MNKMNEDNTKFEILSKTFSLSEYSKLFPYHGYQNPNNHGEIQKLEKYGVRFLGFGLRNISQERYEERKKSMDSNIGVSQDQLSNEEDRDKLESSLLDKGWLTNIFPPSRFINDVPENYSPEVNGRDRELVLIRLGTKMLPHAMLDCSDITVDLDVYKTEVGQSVNHPLPAKVTGKKTIITGGMFLIHKGHLKPNRDDITDWVQNKSMAPHIFKSDSQKPQITQIINAIYKNATTDDNIINQLARVTAENWLRKSIEKDHEGFFSTQGVYTFDDVCLYDPGNTRPKQAFTNNVLGNIAKGETTKIVLYGRENFLKLFKTDVGTFIESLNGFIDLMFHGVLRTLKLDDKTDAKYREFLEGKSYFEIVGYIPTSDAVEHKLMYDAHRTATYEEMFDKKVNF